MTADYPGTIKIFSTKASGQAIASSHINDLQDEVVAVETQLGVNAGAWQNWLPAVTGWAPGYTVNARYCKVGKLCFVYLSVSGTSNGTRTKVTLPLSVSGNPSYSTFPLPYFIDGGTTVQTGGRCYAQVRPSNVSDPNEVYFWLDGSADGWTASGTKFVRVSLFYEVE